MRFAKSLLIPTLLAATLASAALAQQPEDPTPAQAPITETAPAIQPPEAPTAAQPIAEFGYLVCYRQKRFVGAILNTSVFLDEVELADMDNGCYIIAKAAPGAHAVRADEKKDTLPVNVEAGKVYYFRMELAVGLWKGHGRLKEVDATTGEKEFKEWNLKFAPDIRQPSQVVKTIE
jgi:hypothetical protein